MSYRFFPSRQQNFYPPQIPYLAGFHGLGDYASELAAYNAAMQDYNADHTKWLAEKSAYDVAYAEWQKAVKSTKATNNLNANRYNAVMTAYNRNLASYQAAADAWLKNFTAMRAANTAKAKTIAQTYGLSFPAGFYEQGACLTQAAHDAYAAQCTTVKGLLGLGSLDSDCGYKALPICNLGPRPTPPTKPTGPLVKPMPAQPTLRAEPKPPTPPVNTGSGGGSNGGGAPITPGGGSHVTDDTKKSGMIANGLILLAVAGGGYLVYRTLRKPKAS